MQFHLHLRSERVFGNRLSQVFTGMSGQPMSGTGSEGLLMGKEAYRSRPPSPWLSNGELIKSVWLESSKFHSRAASSEVLRVFSGCHMWIKPVRAPGVVVEAKVAAGLAVGVLSTHSSQKRGLNRSVWLENTRSQPVQGC